MTWRPGVRGRRALAGVRLDGTDPSPVARAIVAGLASRE
jgi:hypothetical protein